MGCGFSDEAIVVVKRDANEDVGDPSEDKTSRKRHRSQRRRTRRPRRNMIKDEVIKVTMNRRSETPETGIERNLGKFQVDC